MYRLYFLLFVLFSSLHADEEIQGRLSADMQPQASVGGCVNVVSGSFFFTETDIPATGLGKLSLIRSYDSGNSEKGFFGKGMSHTFPINLKAKENVTGFRKTIDLGLSIGEAAVIPYEGWLMGTQRTACIISKEFYEESGYSGAMNPLNRMQPHLNRVSIEGPEKGKWNITLSNGTKRYFTHKKHYDHRLTLEELPDGQQFSYSYGSDKSLKVYNKDSANARLSTLSMIDGGTKYASIDRKRKCAYHFDSKKRLKKVEGSHLLSQEYEYNSSGKMTKLSREGDEYLQVNYFSSDKHHRGKVKNIKRLSETGSQRLYSFSYEKNKTIVTCPLNNKQTFTYKKKRVSEFEDSSANRAWKYFYTLSGDIRQIQLVDTTTNACRHCVYYDYDRRGNPVSKKVYGQITGLQEDVVLLKGNKPIEGQECQETTFEYSDDGFNLLTKETLPNGTEIHFTYYPDTSLLQSKRTVSGGQCHLREFYRYNAAGFKTEVIEDDGSGEDEDDLREVTYRIKTVSEYEKLLPKTTTQYYFDLVSNQWVLASRKDNVHDKDGRLIEQKVYDSNNFFAYSIFKEYDAHGNVLSEINPLGELTLYTYDELDRKVSEEQFGTGKVTRYDYNKYHELVKEIEEHESGEILTRTHTYDKAGNLTSTTDCHGNKTTYVYDRCSRLVSTIDCQGNIESKVYDLFNHPVSEIDAKGCLTTKRFNIFGRVLTTENPDGTVTRSQYHLDGTLYRKWEVDGSYIEYTYDYLSRIIKEETFSAKGKSLAVTTKTYKGKNLVSEVDARGVKTEYAYDGMARKISMKKGEYVEEYAYDSMGNLFRTIIGDRIELKEFDLLQRVVEERVEDISGNLLRKKTYEYDRFGNVQVEREYTTEVQFSETQNFYNSYNLIERVIDPLGNETTYHYEFSDHFKKIKVDPLGQERHETYDHNMSPVLNEIRCFGQIYSSQHLFYDSAGNCIRQVNDILVDGEKTGEYVLEWEYDPMNRVIREIEQGLKVTETFYSFGRKECEVKPGGVSLFYEYDDFGRVADLHSSDGTVHYQYAYDPIGNLLISLDLVHHTRLEREYDDDNNIVRELLPNGMQSHYSYDSQGRLTKMILPDHSEVEYKHNATDLIAVKRGGKTHTYTYDLAGNILHEIGFHGEETAYVRDANQRVISQVSDHFSQRLEYDAVGNIIKENETAYTYDPLYQLTSDRDHEYRYDSLNNRIEKDGSAYSHNELQQVTSDGKVEYAYDADGNRILKGNVHYRYDALNRLVETEGIHYQYDTFGRLIRRNDETFCYFKNFDLGNENALRIIGQGTIGIEKAEGLYSTICDYRGSVCVVLDQALSERVKYRYSSYGEAKNDGDFHSPWQFYSQRIDSQTGLLHFYKRIYDPVMGSWLTPDPSGFSDGPNLYAYVHNNPLRFCDPYGLSAWEFCKGFGSTIAGIGVACMVRYAAIALATAVNPAAGAAVSVLMTAYSVGSTAYSAGSLVYENYDTLLEVGDRVLAGQFCDLSVEAVEFLKGMPVESWGNLSGNATAALMGGKLDLKLKTKIGNQTAVNCSSKACTNKPSVPPPKLNVPKEGNSLGENKNIWQIWSSTKKRSAVVNAYEHWKKHGGEFQCLENAKQYVEYSHSLLNDTSLLSKTRLNGEILRYDPVNNVFGSFTKDGIPKTVFKPNLGIEYWEAQ